MYVYFVDISLTTVFYSFINLQKIIYSTTVKIPKYLIITKKGMPDYITLNIEDKESIVVAKILVS